MAPGAQRSFQCRIAVVAVTLSGQGLDVAEEGDKCRDLVRASVCGTAEQGHGQVGHLGSLAALRVVGPGRQCRLEGADGQVWGVLQEELAGLLANPENCPPR
jgi:hypothetical protein